MYYYTLNFIAADNVNVISVVSYRMFDHSVRHQISCSEYELW